MARRRLMTKTEYARYVGVDKAQPGRWVKRGMPTAGPNGDMIDPEVADSWRASNIDGSKPKAKAHDIDRLGTLSSEARAASTAPRPARPKAEPAPFEPPSNDASPIPSLDGAIIQFPDGTSMDLQTLPNLNTLNQIDKWYAGELKRREIQVHDREHLPKADLYAATDSLISMFRARLMGLGRRCAPKLEGRSVAERAEIIQDECRKTLEQLARKLGEAASGESLGAEIQEDEPEDSSSSETE